MLRLIIVALLCSCCYAVEPVVYHGACDASAGFYAGLDRFVVADDENNKVRVYKIGSTDGPGQVLDSISEFLEANGGGQEADIEASARIDNLIFWAGSHGRNKNGKLRSDRQVFFATEFHDGPNGVELKPVGKPYKKLLNDLVASEPGMALGLDKSIRLEDKEIKKLAPKEDGINIEGMTARPDGSVYLGLRNPLFDGKALVIHLLNPSELVQGDATARFGEPILLDLGRRGIRAMEYSQDQGVYYIVAGEKNAENNFSVYSWAGTPASQPVDVLGSGTTGTLNPEAAFFANGKLWLLSDDGAMPVKVASAAECLPGEYGKDGTCPNKSLIDDSKKTFRMQSFELKP